MAYDLSRKRNAPAKRVRASSRISEAGQSAQRSARTSAGAAGAAGAASSGGVNGRGAVLLVEPEGAPGGGFSVGDQVLYWSETRARWVQAAVEAKNALEENVILYDLTCKRAVPSGRLRPQFSPGEQVEYFSTGTGRWMPARVLRLRERHGQCDLTIKNKAPWEKLRRAPTAAVAHPTKVGSRLHAGRVVAGPQAAAPQAARAATLPGSTRAAEVAGQRRTSGGSRARTGREAFDADGKTLFEEVEEELALEKQGALAAAPEDTSDEASSSTSVISEAAAVQGWQAMRQGGNPRRSVVAAGAATGPAGAAADVAGKVFMARPKKKVRPKADGGTEGLADDLAVVEANGQKRRRAPSPGTVEAGRKTKEKRRRQEAQTVDRGVANVPSLGAPPAAAAPPAAEPAETKRGRWRNPKREKPQLTPATSATARRSRSRSRNWIRPTPRLRSPPRNERSPITPPAQAPADPRRRPRGADGVTRRGTR